MMQYYKIGAPFLQPEIYLKNNLTPEVNTVKSLGLVWDPKFAPVYHIISQLKAKYEGIKSS